MSAARIFEQARDRAVRARDKAAELSRREAAAALEHVGARARRHMDTAAALARYSRAAGERALTFAAAQWRVV